MQKLTVCALLSWLALFNIPAHAQSDSQNDDKAIKEVISNFYQAWNEHDPKKLASFYTENGDIRTPWNEYGTNRDQVESIFNTEFKKYTHDAHIAETVNSIKTIKPGLVLVDVQSTITGIQGKSDQRLHHHVVYVLQKNDGRWQILISRPF